MGYLSIGNNPYSRTKWVNSPCLINSFKKHPLSTSMFRHDYRYSGCINERIVSPRDFLEFIRTPLSGRWKTKSGGQA
jgi:hypothetical protein